MKKAAEDSTLKISQKFEIPQIAIPEIPEDIIFPDELNRFLREQIRYYAHANGMLQKNLEETELNYDNCKSKVSELQSKLKNYECDGKSILNSNQVASLKIVELSKKVREKNSEVEALKTKNSKLERIIFELKSQQDPAPVAEIKEKPVNESEETVKKLEDKLNNAMNKLMEARNSNLQLKNDLKLANKWLIQEVGESFETLQTNVNAAGGWRGRAQIILDLQQKNNDLKEKLRTAHDKASKSTIEINSSKAESKISILSKENDEVKALYEEMKKKYDISRARCRALDTECTLLKSKYTLIKEQAERDQKIIGTLSTQISSTKEMKNDVLKEKESVINRILKEKDVLAKQIEEYKASLKKFKQDLEAKTTEVESLQGLHACHKCRSKYENDVKINRLETERQKLLELTQTQNNRLVEERDAHFKTQYLLHSEKQRAAKAEANVARIELESNTKSYSTSCSTARALDCTIKDKLELAEENIKALKTRLEMEQFERKADLQEFVKILHSVDKVTENVDDDQTEN